MDKLPTSITIEGIEYHLAETRMSVHDEHNPGWWWLRYRPYNGKTSPHVRIKEGHWHYLTAFASTKEEASSQQLKETDAALNRKR